MPKVKLKVHLGSFDGLGKHYKNRVYRVFNPTLHDDLKKSSGKKGAVITVRKSSANFLTERSLASPYKKRKITRGASVMGKKTKKKKGKKRK